MLGPRQEAQAALFYEFSLEDHVPQDHLLRSIDRFVDLSSIRTHLAGFYSHTGRPSVDPELLIRMLLVGYCFGIRSERRLCEEVHLNLAYRWFCRLDLNDRVPDHSKFSKNRHGLTQSLELFDFYKAQIEACDRRLEAAVGALTVLVRTMIWLRCRRHGSKAGSTMRRPSMFGPRFTGCWART